MFTGNLVCDINDSSYIADEEASILQREQQQNVSVDIDSDSSLLLNRKLTSPISKTFQSMSYGYTSPKLHIHQQNNPKVHTFKILNATDASINFRQEQTTTQIKTPILMCFICKLSFGITKLFVLHANKEHGIDLQEFERSLLLRREYASAIIQKNMDENPQISFLEPDCADTKQFLNEPEKKGETQLSSCTMMQRENNESNDISSDATNTHMNPKGNVSLQSLSTSCSAISLPTTSQANENKPLQYVDDNNQVSPMNFARSIYADDKTRTLTPQNPLLTPAVTPMAIDMSPNTTTGSIQPKSEDKLMDYSSDKNCTESEEDNASLQLEKNDMSWEQKEKLASALTNPSVQLSSLHASWFVLSAEQNTGNVKMISDFLQQQLSELQQQNHFTFPTCIDRLSSIRKGCPLHIDRKGVDCKSCELAEVNLNVKEQKKNSARKQNVTSGITPVRTGNNNQLSLVPKNMVTHNNMRQCTITSTAPPVTTSFTIGACSDHINGRPLDVECIRCEMILNTARLNTSSQQSTRNSCKTLKCPQCNWHYKYQETLEIHMREKHPDGESACGYCLAGQQHPRLARGESYSCGYKPYRCEICNYSTTTKGNLSIHMQSDKHLNNVQELNSSHSIVAAATSANGIVKLDTTASNYIHQYNMIRQHRPQISLPNCESENKSLRSTESETKALKNAQSLNELGFRPNPSFRCDMCNYETAVARNLRIHMTSDKHTQNLSILQNNIKQMQALSVLQQQHNHKQLEDQTMESIGDRQFSNLPYNQEIMMHLLQQTPSSSLKMCPEKDASTVNSAELEKLQHEYNSSLATMPEDSSTMNSLSIELPFKKNDWPTEQFSCLICENFNTNDIDELNQHLTLDRSSQFSQVVDSKQSAKYNFSDRSSSPSCVWSEIMTVQNNNYICFLCKYKTNLRANFQLHSKTDKHLQKLNFINHLREGGVHNESKLKYYQQQHHQKGIYPMQIKCNCCDFFSNSIQQLKVHTKNPHHETMRVTFQYLNVLLRKDNESSNSAMDTFAGDEPSRDRIDKTTTLSSKRALFCKLCNTTLPSLINMIHHVKALHYLQVDNVIRLDEGDEQRTECRLDDFFKLCEVDESDRNIQNGASRELNYNAAETEPSQPNQSAEKNVDTAGYDSAGSSSVTTDQRDTSSNMVYFDNDGGDLSSLIYRCFHCPFSAYNKHDMKLHVDLMHPDKGNGELVFQSPNNINSASPDSAGKQEILSGGEFNDSDSQSSMQTASEKSNVNREEKPSSVNTFPQHIQCPLCHDVFMDVQEFDIHLLNLHSVGRDGLIRLITQLRSLVAKETDTNVAKEAKIPSTDIRLSHSTNPTEPLEQSTDIYCCQQCDSVFKREQQLLMHAQQMKHYIIKQGEYLCLAYNATPNSCNLRFPTPAAMFTHYNDKHINLVISERHVYKYRCKHCSLAFKTREKLSTHLVYHTIRDTTKCRICMRSFRTVQALESHMELAHNETRNVFKCAEEAEMETKMTRDENNLFVVPSPDPVRTELQTSSTPSAEQEPLTTVITEPAKTRQPETDELLQNFSHKPNTSAEEMSTLHNLQKIATAAAASGFALNPVEMLNIIQFHHLMSLNIMNLTPPLLISGTNAVPSGNAMSVTPDTGQSDTMPMEHRRTPPLEKTTTPVPFEAQNTKYKKNVPVVTNPQTYANQKRARTRITNDQLRILRSHFDINNSPSEESIAEMSRESNLPIKVVKHWFRNTLFKERQRNKDSPYNFNNPPSTTFNIEEYERNVQTKFDTAATSENSQRESVSPMQSSHSMSSIGEYLCSQRADGKSQGHASASEEECIPTKMEVQSKSDHISNLSKNHNVMETLETTDAFNSSRHSPASEREHEYNKLSGERKKKLTRHDQSPSLNTVSEHNTFEEKSESNSSDAHSRPQTPHSIHTGTGCSSMTENQNQDLEGLSLSQMGPPKNLQTLTAPTTTTDRVIINSASSSGLSNNSRLFEKHSRSPQYDSNSNSSTSSNTVGKRANRTRFTDYQIKVLQEFFENNSYPKDSDLEYLSKLLLLSPRVIVVWFQNARQKQRKIYENQPNTTVCDSEEKKQNINYACKKCNLVFQRYYELIRHQKNHCFKEENNKRSAKAQIAAAQIAQNLSSEDSNSSIDINSTAAPSLLTHQSPLSQTPPVIPGYNKNLRINRSIISGYSSKPNDDADLHSLKCGKCPLSFSDVQQLRQHQLMHLFKDNLCPTEEPTNIESNPFYSLLEQLHHKSDTKIPKPVETANKSLINKRKYSDALSKEEENFSLDSYSSSFGYQTPGHMNNLLYQNLMRNENENTEMQEVNEDFLRTMEQKKLKNYDFLLQYYEKNEQKRDDTFEMVKNKKPNIESLWQYYQLMESYKYFQLEYPPQPMNDRMLPMNPAELLKNSVGRNPNSGNSAESDINNLGEMANYKLAELIYKDCEDKNLGLSKAKNSDDFQNKTLGEGEENRVAQLLSRTSEKIDQLDGLHELNYNYDSCSTNSDEEKHQRIVNKFGENAKQESCTSLAFSSESQASAKSMNLLCRPAAAKRTIPDFPITKRIANKGSLKRDLFCTDHTASPAKVDAIMNDVEKIKFVNHVIQVS
ncbi:Zn finger homeodomain 2 [Haematobia irritans]|uniref:Zn finger homeodomain 2 n=1 Tax=Haematobia irritans TaxID=7368 RepID=UPI003F4F9522